MSQRRMFSKDVTENDAFLDMPLSSQALYFHLGMQADDDGFVSPNRILRMIGCQSDDLRILIAKKFVLSFPDGVIVIKHWKINNYLRPDRYKETTHAEKMNLLTIKNNGSYTWYTSGIPDDIPLVDAGKDRIGKDRIGKVISSSSSDDEFTSFWKAYPRKVGKGNAEKAWKKHKPPIEIVLVAIEAQKKTDQWSKDEGKFIPHPTTWLNGKRWEDEITTSGPNVLRL